jgi:hypothetical protein
VRIASISSRVYAFGAGVSEAFGMNIGALLLLIFLLMRFTRFVAVFASLFFTGFFLAD